MRRKVEIVGVKEVVDHEGNDYRVAVSDGLPPYWEIALDAAPTIRQEAHRVRELVVRGEHRYVVIADIGIETAMDQTERELSTLREGYIQARSDLVFAKEELAKVYDMNFVARLRFAFTGKVPGR